MNSKEAQSALEIMLAQSLTNRLTELGANTEKAQAATAKMDFNTLRGHLSRTPEDLQQQLAALFG